MPVASSACCCDRRGGAVAARRLRAGAGWPRRECRVFAGVLVRDFAVPSPVDRGAVCPLCAGDGGEVLFRDELLRVVLADDPDYPGFARVILHAHVREMTDLPVRDRRRLLDAVLAVEAAQREVLAPLKVNLASLGNQVPHLHWHVIPRFADDAHFPQPIWGARQRQPDPQRLAERRRQLAALRDAIVARLAA